MKKVTKMVSWFFMAAFLFALAGCGLEVPGTDTLTEDSSDNNSVTTISSNINTNTTWTSDKVYVIESGISVNAILTIQPGTIIKFKSGKGISVGSSGLIYANGTATGPIIFTSYKDDAHGGDTNGDGSITSAAVGDWNEIYLSADDSQFNYCQFYYGGSGYYDDGTGNTIDLSTHKAKITNSIFAYNGGGNLSSINGVIGAGDAAAGTIITGNTFYGNNIPLEISGRFSVEDSNTFHNPSNTAEKNTYNGIFKTTNDVDASVTWSETEVPFVMEQYWFYVNTGVTLTLGENVIIKFMSGSSIDVKGTIVYGSGVWFTSIKDDAYAGDTNGDNNTTTAAVGDWNGIYNSSFGNWNQWSNIVYDSH